MSAIYGFVGFEDKDLLKRMNDALQHPIIHNEHFIHSKVSLGVNWSDSLNHIHFDEERELLLINNGQIYAQYGDKSDWVLESYANNGIRFLEELKGHFTLALYDLREKKLIISTDILNTKPIFYLQIGGSFLFSSQIGPLLLYGDYTPELNRDALNYYLTYVYVPAPLSIYKNIRKLPAGHYAEATIDGNVNIHKYIDISFMPKHETGFDGTLLELNNLFEKSILRRLDNNVGVLLSGGIDSGIIASLATKLSTRQIDTFTLGFNDGKYDERKEAQFIADELNTNHHSFEADSNLIDDLPEVIRILEEPHADPGVLPLYCVTKKARDYCNGLLGGDGGDELFWSYNWFFKDTRLDKYLSMPWIVRRPLTKMLGFLPGKMVPDYDGIHKYEMMDYANLDWGQQSIARMTRFIPSELNEIYRNYDFDLSSENTFQKAQSYLNTIETQEFKEKICYLTIKMTLQNNGLYKAGKLSYANDIGFYMPFLDNGLLDFVTKIPTAFMIGNGERKYLLKKYAEQYRLLPKKILSAGKKGFGGPIEDWLSGDYKDHLIERTLENKDFLQFFDEYYVKKLLDRMGGYESTQRAYTFLVFSIWYDNFLNLKDMKV
ncbi:MAG: asparagine synthetase B family protein [Candidatus Thorarchaeota archaeon]